MFDLSFRQNPSFEGCFSNYDMKVHFELFILHVGVENKFQIIQKLLSVERY